MADGQVLIEITAENKQAKQVIRETTQQLNNAGREWESAGDKFLGIFKKIATSAIIVKAGRSIINLGKQAVQAASDLQEVQNVVDVTFGAASKSIDAWAKNAINQFGLTETQAKQFTSTLGAMMKSSGVAGDDIVKMSTDLAGLAADMASFYNMDFETAFQKIRSGISGETEPLKQLGINMSVANLEAYALTQGITKSFDAMSQGEKTMLRYQYIMQATSDAQGDFARTSDGFANAQRKLESNLQSLETKIGGPLVSALAEASGWIDNLITNFMPIEKQPTIFDQIAEIDLKKAAKLEEITLIKTQAEELTKVLEGLGAPSSVGSDLSKIAEGANKIGSNTPTLWSSLLQTLSQINGLENLFTDSTGANNITSIAYALSGASLEQSKADAWATFLGALQDNAGALTTLTGTGVEETKQWLEELAQAANELDPANADAWDQLLGRLLTGLPGLADTDEGRTFLQGLATNFLAMGNESDTASRGLSALGYNTDEIAEKQAIWLETCKELVRTIPGLSSIIDTNTGEIQGGLPALKQFADEWERTARYQAEIEAIREKRGIYESMTDPVELKASSIEARADAIAKLKVAGYSESEINQNLDAFEAQVRELVNAGYQFEEAKRAFFDVKDGYGDVDVVSSATMSALSAQANGIEDLSKYDWVNKLKGPAEQSVLAYIEALYTEIQTEMERPYALEAYEQAVEDTAEAYGVATEEIKEQTNAVITLGESYAELDEEQEKTWTDALKAVEDAAKAVDEYREKTVEATRQSLKSWGGMFDRIQTAEEKIRNEYQGEDIETEINLKISTGEIKSAGNMLANLEQRARYLADYAAKMEQAREMGYNADVLANLADGSFESYENLVALTADGANVDAINNAFASVQSAEVTLADTLAGYQLDADSAFQDLTQTLTDSMNTLDSMVATDAPALAIGSTIDAVLNTIYSKYAALQGAVSSVSSMLGMLTETNIGFHGMTIGGGHGGFSMAWGYNGSHADGLDYVPFDGYIGQLHRGEAVLTAQEAQVWREFRNGIDANSLAGAIWDNSPDMGGNVYLNGESVGRIMSAAQADSYRQLERSGWRG
jgi:hypothetical protein